MENNRKTIIAKDDTKRPIKVTMNNVVSRIGELSFTVRLYTGKNTNKEDMKFKVVKVLREFETLEEQLINDKKLIRNAIVK